MYARIPKCRVPKKVWKPVFYSTISVTGLAGTSMNWKTTKLLQTHNQRVGMTYFFVASAVEERVKWLHSTMKTQWVRCNNEKIHAYGNLTSNSEERRWNKEKLKSNRQTCPQEKQVFKWYCWHSWLLNNFAFFLRSVLRVLNDCTAFSKFRQNWFKHVVRITFWDPIS